VRLLLADDDPMSALLLKKRLEGWSYEVTQVDNGLDALTELSRPDAPRLAILDWEMPGLNGIDVIQQLRRSSSAQERYVYTLLLTSRTQEEDIVRGLDAGADDFHTKPYRAAELQARLRVGERFLQLQNNLLAVQEELRLQAFQDSLTRLPNRRTVLKHLEQDITRCHRDNQPLGVLMLDLDRFKSINDTYGHSAGDAVLKESGVRMQEVLRSYDMVGRFGGEEFLIVLPNADASATLSIASRICAALRATPVEFDGLSIPFTCSIGAAISPPGALSSERELINAADAALYHSKRAGRDQVTASWQLAAA
jgi:two-component system cell cycle response regulator